MWHTHSIVPVYNWICEQGVTTTTRGILLSDPKYLPTTANTHPLSLTLSLSVLQSAVFSACKYVKSYLLRLSGRVSYSYLYTRCAAVEYDIKDAAVSESALMAFGVDSKSRLRAHAAHHHKNREIAFCLKQRHCCCCSNMTTRVLPVIALF